jgi:uncharacterized protein
MKKIGLLSDTHSYLHPRIFEFFKECDEVWHAGDIGDLATADELGRFKPLKAVYGNIDGSDVRRVYPLEIHFLAENVRVLMTHIGGYPGHYPKSTRDMLQKYRPDLFICGHSHILKVMYDKQYRFLHINPGAAGRYGFHLSVTLVRFNINGNKIEDLEVLDIPRGGERSDPRSKM